LPTDPTFKQACGRVPGSGGDLCPQARISRSQNAPILREIMAPTGALVDAYCARHATAPDAVTLDIDDLVDAVHSHQQIPLFNAHQGERCSRKRHVQHIAAGRLAAVILRPGKTASGSAAGSHGRCIVRGMRR
jgi:hypothetical protein